MMNKIVATGNFLHIVYATVNLRLTEFTIDWYSHKGQQFLCVPFYAKRAVVMLHVIEICVCPFRAEQDRS